MKDRIIYGDYYNVNHTLIENVDYLNGWIDNYLTIDNILIIDDIRYKILKIERCLLLNNKEETAESGKNIYVSLAETNQLFTNMMTATA